MNEASRKHPRVKWTCLTANASLRRQCRRKCRICIMHDIVNYHHTCQELERSDSPGEVAFLTITLFRWRKRMAKGRTTKELTSLPVEWKTLLTKIISGATKLEELPPLQPQCQHREIIRLLNQVSNATILPPTVHESFPYQFSDPFPEFWTWLEELPPSLQPRLKKERLSILVQK
jgi:hypothetical protein